MTSECWLEGVVAVVVGPRQGKAARGSQIPRGLAQCGGPVSVNDLAKELLQATLDRPPSRGNGTWRIPRNLAAAHSARQAITTLAVHDRQVHILASNATVNELVPAEERLSNAHSHCQIGVDLSDPFSTCPAALTDRIPSGRSHVITTGSLATRRTDLRDPMNTTARSGPLNLTQHTGSERASSGVPVPTGIRSPRIFRPNLTGLVIGGTCSGLPDSGETGKLVASLSHRPRMPLPVSHSIEGAATYCGASWRTKATVEDEGQPTDAIVTTDRRRERGYHEFTAVVRP